MQQKDSASYHVILQQQAKMVYMEMYKQIDHVWLPVQLLQFQHLEIQLQIYVFKNVR